MQGKQLARLVAAVIFIIYSNFFLSAIAADVPQVNDLRAPGTVKDYTLSSSKGVPPSLAPFLPMTSTDACFLYDKYVDALKGGITGYRSTGGLFSLCRPKPIRAKMATTP